jgi:phosphatidylglycerol---prolipoprotein diacylglyceryl transferase
MHIKSFSIPIYGSFAIHGYGIAIFTGILITFLCTYFHLKKIQKTSFSDMSSIFAWTILVGFIGGRLLYVLTEYNYESIWQVFEFWYGGFSVLGTVIAVILYLPFALKKRNISFFPLIDIIALYTPLANAFGRLGCLWTGCCNGYKTSSWFHVIYEGHTAGAPTHTPLLPTQLLSSMTFFLLFLILYFFVAPRFKKPGSILLAYVMGLSIERFLLDFLRDDRLIKAGQIFSFHQWLALTIVMICILIIISRQKNKAS